MRPTFRCYDGSVVINDGNDDNKDNRVVERERGEKVTKTMVCIIGANDVLPQGMLFCWKSSYR